MKPRQNLVISAACLLAAAPAAQATSYNDIFTGPFGSVSWAAPMKVALYEGGSFDFNSSYTRSHLSQETDALYVANASNSLLDGTLHVQANAGACSRNCHLWHAYSNAGTAFWDTLNIDYGPGGDRPLIPMKLEVEGLSMGVAYVRLRYYIGVGYPNSQDWYSSAWKVLASPTPLEHVDAVFDMGTWGGGNVHGLKIRVEIEAHASSYSDGLSFADFGNTAHFKWVLPEGVQVSSASGQFMTTAVPEPQSWALMLAGLALLPAWLRRRSRR